MTASRLIPDTLKGAITIALSLGCLPLAQANIVDGTIYAHTATDASGAGTTVDYWQFTLTTPANVEIDVVANEGYVNAWGSPPGAYVDLNGDGEVTLADTHFRLFQTSVSLETEVTAADDSAAYLPPGNSGGWADGSLSSRDSYLNTALDVGTYIIAFSDYQLTSAEAVSGFNAGDTISAATGTNPFTGATGQDHFDYRMAFNFTDFETNQPLNIAVTPSAVPVPAAVWLFGSALAGWGLIGRRSGTAATAT